MYFHHSARETETISLKRSHQEQCYQVNKRPERDRRYVKWATVGIIPGSPEFAIGEVLDSK